MLRVDGLIAGYGSVEVLSGISLCVAGGELVSLLGANGAGKTTTLRAISGLIRPKGGRIEFAGRRIDGMKSADIVRAGLSHCPEGRELFPDMTVYETLVLGSYSARLKKPELLTRMDTVFDLFHTLAERRGQRAGTLSGGEQQMLAIGRALMMSPKLLMLDEPSLGLAPKLVDDLFKTISEIRARGTTVLLVEQNAAMALEICERAYVLETGHIVMEGTCSSILSDRDLRRSYLGEAGSVASIN